MQDTSANTGIGLLVALVVFTIIALIIRAVNKEGKKRTSGAGFGVPTTPDQQNRMAQSYVKRCPTCKSIFTDETLAFCLSDGSTLERVPDTFTSNDPKATLVYPEARDTIPPTMQYRPDMFPNKKD